VNGVWPAFAQLAAILLAGAAAGYALAPVFLPRSAPRAERAAWGFALGLTLLALPLPPAFLLGLSPFLAIVLTAVLTLAAAWFYRASPLSPRGGRGVSPQLTSASAVAAGHASREAGGRQDGVSAAIKPLHVFLILLILFGVLVFSLRSLAEPLWSNDFLAIWGLKGKTIFAAAAIPRRLFTDPSLGFSHPEYPLGLPLLFAAVSFLLGRWDDQALALLYPVFQIATLFALIGWLRRRGASAAIALAAGAILAQFEPLYSAFQAGLADIPFSFAALLFGCALADLLDATDPLAARRLAFAAFLTVSTKNEGLFLIAAGAVIALFASRSARAAARSALIAIAVPAVLLTGIGRVWKGSLSVRDFDFTLLARPRELFPRAGEAIRTAFSEVMRPAWSGVLCLGVLIGAGRSIPRGNRLLALSLVCALAYLLLPTLAILGPEWLIRTSFARTVSALAPLTTAAVAARLSQLTADS
jgi:hypothetical protein